MSGARRATIKQIRTIGLRLGMSSDEITIHLAAEHVPDAATSRRVEMLRHWTAEAIAIASGPIHWNIVRLCRSKEFRSDCRWIAQQTGVTIDEVNIALTRLLRLELIDGQWRDKTGLTSLTEHEFRKLALERVRIKAAEDQIQFSKEKPEWETQ